MTQGNYPYTLTIPDWVDQQADSPIGGHLTIHSAEEGYQYIGDLLSDIHRTIANNDPKALLAYLQVIDLLAIAGAYSGDFSGPDDWESLILMKPPT